MHFNRSEHTASILSNEKVLVVGGTDYNGSCFNSAELYDLTTRNWTNAGNMNEFPSNISMETIKNPQSAPKIFMSANEKVSVIGKENFTTTKDKQLH